MNALERSLLRLFYGLSPDPRDSEELGRIFDATSLYGLPTTHTEPPDTAHPTARQGSEET